MRQLNNMQFLTSIKPLTADYDLLILDLWGVIHDGCALYPNVKECLERLRQEKKKIIFLSNAPRRAEVVATALHQMGITDDLYDRIVTSGEVFFDTLTHPSKEFFNPRNHNYVYMGLERDRKVLEGLHYTEVKNPDDAAFLLLSHHFYDHQPMEELMPILEGCLRNKLPTLCINPDKEIVRLDGTHVPCAGVIAEEYTSMGGEVLYFGKPHRIVYHTCLHGFEHMDTKRIIAVGDSLANDIAGANGYGITSVLVTGGILKKSVGSEVTAAYKSKLTEILSGEKVKPDYAVPAFNWS